MFSQVFIGVEEAIDVFMLTMVVAPALAIDFSQYVRILKTLPLTMQCLHNGGVSPMTHEKGRALYRVMSSSSAAAANARLASSRSERSRISVPAVWTFPAAKRFVIDNVDDIDELFKCLGCDFLSTFRVKLQTDTIIECFRVWFLLLTSTRFVVRHT